VTRRLLDLVWPRRCEICGGESDRPGSHVCSECLNRIPFIPAEGVCRVCSRHVEGASGGFLCGDCAGANAPLFDIAVSAVRYEDKVREAIHAYKFNGRFHMEKDFAEWMAAAARARLDVSAVDVVVPVPVTWWRRIDRGFNQSAYLAKDVAKAIGRRCDTRVLSRAGRPKRQSGLDEDARRENAKGTFAVRKAPWVRGRTVLVVDDIMTTGATFSECARVLKEAGAWRVWCLSLARSVI